MDKQFYRSLLMLVNDKDQMERLEEYVAERIRHHRDNLEKQKDINRILEAQGAILELKRFKTLRDEVIKGAE
jgi:hypothetical protein|tara:strand:+ start:105 stop:320 length:216 start_codon:yes stop_codon:yes gene_type:complete